MAILTNIEVRFFNIIRYLILNIVIDIIVRKGLDGLEHFHRRLSLYRGRSVSVSALRVDRYNLVGTLRSGHLLSALLLFAVTLVAYGVEIGLEYAVDSRAIRYPERGNITRVQFETGVCPVQRLASNDNLRHSSSIAEQCVTFVDGVYRFYRPVWVREGERDFGLLCETVDQNRLYEGEGVYGPRFASEGASEVQALTKALTGGSHKSFGDSFHPLVVLNVSSSDVFQRSTFFTPEAQFFTAMFMKNVRDTSVQCIGFTLGRADEDTFLLQLLGCVDSFDENGSLVITAGTSSIDVKSEIQDDGSFEWNTQVAFEMRTRVPHYFRGVADKQSDSQANATAYALFLSRSFPRDIINLNKYAIVYRFCDQISMPIRNGRVWEEEYEFSRSEVRVTATVEEWGIVLVACWVAVVTVAHLLVRCVALRKRMPDKLLGEKYLLRRWAEDIGGRDLGGDGGDDAFLSVQEGLKVDYITATVERRSLRRNKKKSFE